MGQHAKTIEGTWEEVRRQGARFAGRRVRLTVLPEKAARGRRPKIPVAIDEETARFIEEFAGSWVGDDLDDCLAMVHEARWSTDR